MNVFRASGLQEGQCMEPGCSTCDVIVVHLGILVIRVCQKHANELVKKIKVAK